MNRRLLLISGAEAGAEFLMEFAVFGINDKLDGNFHLESRAVKAPAHHLNGAAPWVADRQHEEAALWLKRWYREQFSEELSSEAAKLTPITETELLYAKLLGFWNQGFGILAKRAKTEPVRTLALNVVGKPTLETELLA